MPVARPDSHPPHRANDGARRVSCAVVTVSDTRTEEDDVSGSLARDLFHEAGHAVKYYRIVPDEGEKIRSVLLHLAGQVECVVTTGGTGIAPRDTTIEIADRLIRKALPGFGELFRVLSFEAVGASALLTRSTAGLYGPDDGPAETLLFCCPGSPEAVRLALERLVLPELPHIVAQSGARVTERRPPAEPLP